MERAGASDTADPLGLVARSHPVRAALSQEMHLRRLPPIAAPAHLLQVLVLIDDAEGAAAQALVAELRGPGAPALADGARHALFEAEGMRAVWERHAEFATATFIRADLPANPFDPVPFAALSPFLKRLPGAVLRATLVAVAPAADEGGCKRSRSIDSPPARW